MSNIMRKIWKQVNCINYTVCRNLFHYKSTLVFQFQTIIFSKPLKPTCHGMRGCGCGFWDASATKAI